LKTIIPEQLLKGILLSGSTPPPPVHQSTKQASVPAPDTETNTDV